jgi:hypothetical protein
MSTYRFANVPSNDSVATVVTLAVSAWLTLAAGTILADGGAAAADVPQRAVLMEEAVPASPTPLPVAAAPQVHEKIVVEAQRLQRVAAVPEVCEKIVVEAQRIHA